jgi:hypothetical protein
MARIRNQWMQLAATGIEERRWMVKPLWDLQTSFALRSGSRVTGWDRRSAVLVPLSDAPPEDLPVCVDQSFIVSSRLKEDLENRAPDHAQYLPVSVERAPRGSSYWVANWLHMIDCAVRKGNLEFSIDSSRIPSNIVIGRILGFNIKVIGRRDLCSYLEEQYSGVNLYSIHDRALGGGS